MNKKTAVLLQKTIWQLTEGKRCRMNAEELMRELIAAAQVGVEVRR